MVGEGDGGRVDGEFDGVEDDEASVEDESRRAMTQALKNLQEEESGK